VHTDTLKYSNQVLGSTKFSTGTAIQDRTKFSTGTAIFRDDRVPDWMQVLADTKFSTLKYFNQVLCGTKFSTGTTIQGRTKFSTGTAIFRDDRVPDWIRCMCR
jgi:hypothetical protein